MDTLHRVCAGLDVHKDTVVACVRRLDERDRVRREVRTFGTTTPDLLELLDWLVECHVPLVAMESTGVYWKPIFNLLEGRTEVMLVNPEHIKKVPGRKTDVKDCEWIAQLLQHGLLRASFVPPRPIRELRDLTRQRTQLTGEKARVSNRIQKVLEDANIKLGSVATDVLGVSGRDVLGALIAGQDSAEALANLARGRLRNKLPQLRKALTGRVTEHHRFLLRLHLEHLTHMEALIGQLDQRIHQETEKDRPPEPAGGNGPPPDVPATETAQATAPPARASAAETAQATVPPAVGDAPTAPKDAVGLGLWQALCLLVTIPGISRKTAEVVLAEIGTDMGRFETSEKLASWAGLCPGSNESAGKRMSGRTRHGDRWLRSALVQSAWAVSRAKQTYLQAQYRRLARRRGKKKALIAVAHTMLGMCYQVLKKRQPYQELGADYLDKLGPEQKTKQLVRQLEHLGHKVTLEPQVAA
jgi:transposase